MLLLADPINIYYLTGLYFSTARLLIQKKKMTLFVDQRYGEKAKDFKTVIVDNQIDEALKKHLKGKVAISSTDVTLSQFNVWKKWRGVTWDPKPHLLSHLRKIKTKQEIDKIKKACHITATCYPKLLRKLKAGITEKEMARQVEILFLEHGADGLAFPAIVCFGENSAVPHHSPTDRKLKKGDIVQFDIGCKKDHYCSDFSRVHFFGPPDPRLKKLVPIVEEAKKAAEKVRAKIIDVDRAARQVIEKHGYGPCFIHSVGHGLGLEVHEVPFVKQTPDEKLKEGMIFTIEPGIYLEGIGGVRIEDTYVMTKGGPRALL